MDALGNLNNTLSAALPAAGLALGPEATGFSTLLQSLLGPTSLPRAEVPTLAAARLPFTPQGQSVDSGVALLRHDVTIQVPTADSSVPAAPSLVVPSGNSTGSGLGGAKIDALKGPALKTKAGKTTPAALSKVKTRRARGEKARGQRSEANSQKMVSAADVPPLAATPDVQISAQVVSPTVEPQFFDRFLTTTPAQADSPGDTEPTAQFVAAASQTYRKAAEGFGADIKSLPPTPLNSEPEPSSMATIVPSLGAIPENHQPPTYSDTRLASTPKGMGEVTIPAIASGQQTSATLESQFAPKARPVHVPAALSPQIQERPATVTAPFIATPSTPQPVAPASGQETSQVEKPSSPIRANAASVTPLPQQVSGLTPNELRPHTSGVQTNPVATNRLSPSVPSRSKSQATSAGLKDPVPTNVVSSDAGLDVPSITTNEPQTAAAAVPMVGPQLPGLETASLQALPSSQPEGFSATEAVTEPMVTSLNGETAVEAKTPAKLGMIARPLGVIAESIPLNLSLDDLAAPTSPSVAAVKAPVLPQAEVSPTPNLEAAAKHAPEKPGEFEPLTTRWVAAQPTTLSPAEVAPVTSPVPAAKSTKLQQAEVAPVTTPGAAAKPATVQQAEEAPALSPVSATKPTLVQQAVIAPVPTLVTATKVATVQLAEAALVTAPIAASKRTTLSQAGVAPVPPQVVEAKPTTLLLAKAASIVTPVAAAKPATVQPADAALATVPLAATKPTTLFPAGAAPVPSPVVAAKPTTLLQAKAAPFPTPVAATKPTTLQPAEAALVTAPVAATKLTSLSQAAAASVLSLVAATKPVLQKGDAAQARAPVAASNPTTPSQAGVAPVPIPAAAAQPASVQQTEALPVTTPVAISNSPIPQQAGAALVKAPFAVTKPTTPSQAGAAPVSTPVAAAKTATLQQAAVAPVPSPVASAIPTRLRPAEATSVPTQVAAAKPPTAWHATPGGPLETPSVQIQPELASTSMSQTPESFQGMSEDARDQAQPQGADPSLAGVVDTPDPSFPAQIKKTALEPNAIDGNAAPLEIAAQPTFADAWPAAALHTAPAPLPAPSEPSAAAGAPYVPSPAGNSSLRRPGPTQNIPSVPNQPKLSKPIAPPPQSAPARASFPANSGAPSIEPAQADIERANAPAAETVAQPLHSAPTASTPPSETNVKQPAAPTTQASQKIGDFCDSNRIGTSPLPAASQKIGDFCDSNRIGTSPLPAASQKIGDFCDSNRLGTSPLSAASQSEILPSAPLTPSSGVETLEEVALLEAPLVEKPVKSAPTVSSPLALDAAPTASGVQVSPTPPPPATNNEALESSLETIKAALRRNLETAAGRPRQIDIDLHPAHLGQVKIQVNLQADGYLDSTLHVSNPDVAEHLKSHLEKFTQQLQDEGVPFRTPTVRVDSSTSFQSNAQGWEGGRQSSRQYQTFDKKNRENSVQGGSTFASDRPIPGVSKQSGPTTRSLSWRV